MWLKFILEIFCSHLYERDCTAVNSRESELARQKLRQINVISKFCGFIPVLQKIRFIKYRQVLVNIHMSSALFSHCIIESLHLSTVTSDIIKTNFVASTQNPFLRLSSQ